MLAKRIIPCLDVMGGRVVKGKKFRSLQYAGNAAMLAKKYDNDGADELVLLDISATNEERKTMLSVVRAVASEIFIPLTVGGGIKSIEDARRLLKAGADKVSINTAAVKNPGMIEKASGVFGSQCIVAAIDAKKNGKTWEVFVKSGKEATGMNALEWAKKAESLGAGEILLTSIDKDGARNGFDLELTKAVSQSVNIPVIASGGAKDPESFFNVFSLGMADAALAASIFHFGSYSVGEVKDYLSKKGVEVRK